MARKRKSGTGTIRQRKDGRWEGRAVVGYDDKGLPKTKNVLAKTKHECQEKLTKLMETVGSAKSEKICADMPFGEWMDFWYQTYIKSGLRPATQNTYESTIYQHITVFEEVGHGACASIPADVTELLSVDMGCVGEGLECTECQVSICSKDSAGPYHYEVVSSLINAAKKAGADFAVDVYPHYGSDADAALEAGIDARHGLIGPGVYASHGYERSHIKGVENTLKLLQAYLG